MAGVSACKVRMITTRKKMIVGVAVFAHGRNTAFWSKDWLDVDGEVVPFGPIEARPHPRAMRVLMPERARRSCVS